MADTSQVRFTVSKPPERRDLATLLAVASSATAAPASAASATAAPASDPHICEAHGHYFCLGANNLHLSAAAVESASPAAASS